MINHRHNLTALLLLPVLLAVLLALPTTHAQLMISEPTVIEYPILSIDPTYLQTFEPLDTTQPAETDTTTTESGDTQDTYTRPPADTTDPAETAEPTPERTTPDDGSTRLPTGTFTPRLPGLTIDPGTTETPPPADCPPTDTPSDVSIGNDTDRPTAPCAPAAPIFPLVHPLLFITPFLGLLLFWGIMSYFNARHGSLSDSLRQRHLSNSHLGTVAQAHRQTCDELLDFLASSTDSARPFNYQALEQFLARLALLGSPETNQIADKIRLVFENQDRQALKPLIHQLTASIRRDLR